MQAYYQQMLPNSHDQMEMLPHSYETLYVKTSLEREVCEKMQH